MRRPWLGHSSSVRWFPVSLQARSQTHYIMDTAHEYHHITNILCTETQVYCDRYTHLRKGKHKNGQRNKIIASLATLIGSSLAKKHNENISYKDNDITRLSTTF